MFTDNYKDMLAAAVAGAVEEAREIRARYEAGKVRKKDAAALADCARFVRESADALGYDWRAVMATI